MNLKLKHITLLLSLLALSACTERPAVEDPSTSANGKTPIELSVGGVDGNHGVVTRASSSAVITQNETGMISFPENTNIFMVMHSEYDTNNPDFSGSQAPKTTVTRGYVAKGTNQVTFDAVNQRYWDDAHARSSQLSIWAYAQMYKTNWTQCTFQKIADENQTGWAKFNDAVYFTSSTSNSYDWNQGDVYPGIKYWNVTHNSDGVQDGTSILCQDLLFSNNLADNTDYSKGDNRLKFNFTTHKFPENPQMYFRHAMSKITIHIKEGDGFIKTGDDANSDFKFTPKTSNVKLTRFNTKGVFNIKEGEFQWVWPADANDQTGAGEPTEIPKIYQHTTADAGDAYTLEALAIPNIHAFKSAMKDANDLSLGLSDIYSRFVQDANNLASDVMMEFSIDNNTYRITSGTLYNALVDGSGNAVTNATKKTDNGTYIPLEAGKNYVFTFTVSKSKISGITAQVAEWEMVNADNIDPTNARISLQLEDRGTAVTSNVDFYRAADPDNNAISDTYEGYNWASGYSNGSGATYSSSAWHPTNWYWPDNTTFYHFRAVGDKTSSNPAAPTVSSDAFTLTAGETYKDYIWGAPFKELDSPTPSANTAKIVYNTTDGFDGTYDGSNANTHQIYHGIGPTSDPIKLLMFHMMSDVTINVMSVSGDAAVQLGDGSNGNCTTIKFEKIYKSGKVNLGNGLVEGVYESGESAKGDYSFTTHPAPDASGVITWANYGAIPQNLDGPTTATTDDVILVITTPDHNEYRVSMKDVAVTAQPTTTNIANPYTTTNSSGKYIIDSWYPGFKYTYTFTLSKKKIEDLSATIVNWETVTADNEDVTIK